MKLKQNRGGFTLMEVLIVVVVLAVLAGLAVPMYTASVEKSRKAEALAALGALRQSELRFFAQTGAYTNAIANLDFDPASVAGGQTLHFTYAVATPSAVTFTATATRNATDLPAGAPANRTVTITQAGVVGGTM